MMKSEDGLHLGKEQSVLRNQSLIMLHKDTKQRKIKTKFSRKSSCLHSIKMVRQDEFNFCYTLKSIS